jgi:hypothetical protein
MTKKIILLSIASLLLAVDMLPQSLIEQKKTVAFIFGTTHPVNADKTPVLDANKNAISLEMPLGTGFFVGYTDPRGGPDFTFCYLVTAKHVLRDFNEKLLPKVRLRLNLQGDDAGVEFDKDVAVSDETGKLLWFASKDEAVDLAVLPLLPDLKKFDLKAIPISMFVDGATLQSKSVSEGDSLYFIGLLAQFYGVHRNYPVFRRGTLAMMTDELIDTPSGKQKGFVAELQSWPGNSGAPVFLNLSGFRGTGDLTLGGKDTLRLLGVLEGVFENKVQVSVVGQPGLHGSTGTDAPVGVSIVIPAMQIREILDSPVAQHQRDLEIQRLQKSNSPR